MYFYSSKSKSIKQQIQLFGIFRYTSSYIYVIQFQPFDCGVVHMLLFGLRLRQRFLLSKLYTAIGLLQSFSWYFDF